MSEVNKDNDNDNVKDTGQEIGKETPSPRRRQPKRKSTSTPIQYNVTKISNSSILANDDEVSQDSSNETQHDNYKPPNDSSDSESDIEKVPDTLVDFQESEEIDQNCTSTSRSRKNTQVTKKRKRKKSSGTYEKKKKSKASKSKKSTDAVNQKSKTSFGKGKVCKIKFAHKSDFDTDKFFCTSNLIVENFYKAYPKCYFPQFTELNTYVRKEKAHGHEVKRLDYNRSNSEKINNNPNPGKIRNREFNRNTASTGVFHCDVEKCPFKIKYMLNDAMNYYYLEPTTTIVHNHDPLPETNIYDVPSRNTLSVQELNKKYGTNLQFCNDESLGKLVDMDTVDKITREELLKRGNDALKSMEEELGKYTEYLSGLPCYKEKIDVKSCDRHFAITALKSVDEDYPLSILPGSHLFSKNKPNVFHKYHCVDVICPLNTVLLLHEEVMHYAKKPTGNGPARRIHAFFAEAGDATHKIKDNDTDIVVFHPQKACEEFRNMDTEKYSCTDCAINKNVVKIHHSDYYLNKTPFTQKIDSMDNFEIVFGDLHKYGFCVMKYKTDLEELKSKITDVEKKDELWTNLCDDAGRMHLKDDCCFHQRGTKRAYSIPLTHLSFECWGPLLDGLIKNGFPDDYQWFQANIIKDTNHLNINDQMLHHDLNWGHFDESDQNSKSSQTISTNNIAPSSSPNEEETLLINTISKGINESTESSNKKTRKKKTGVVTEKDSNTEMAGVQVKVEGDVNAGSNQEDNTKGENEVIDLCSDSDAEIHLWSSNDESGEKYLEEKRKKLSNSPECDKDKKKHKTITVSHAWSDNEAEEEFDDFSSVR